MFDDQTVQVERPFEKIFGRRGKPGMDRAFGQRVRAGESVSGRKIFSIFGSDGMAFVYRSE